MNVITYFGWNLLIRFHANSYNQALNHSFNLDRLANRWDKWCDHPGPDHVSVLRGFDFFYIYIFYTENKILKIMI